MTTSYTDFDSLFAQVLKFYVEGEYGQACDLITAGIKQFPQNAQFLRLARSMIQVRMGHHDVGLDELRDLIEGGYWLGERQWLDSDYDAVRDLPEFKRLQAICNNRLKAIQTEAKPELVTFVPDEDGKPAPLLLVLHGNGSNVFWHQHHWQSASAAGWVVALPQSSQVAGLDTAGNLSYSWNDETIVDREIHDHLATLNANYSLDPARAVVGGFSRGAENAIRLVLTGEVPAQGFIAVCPGGPYLTQPDLWTPVIDAAGKAGRTIKGHVIIGGQDHFGDATEQLITMLRGVGVVCEREFHAEMGHTYPPDFDSRLVDILASLS